MGTSEGFEDLLAAATQGDESAASALLPLVYDELRAIARRLLGSRGRNHTLQPTALVHDAYMKLARNRDSWDNRRHFLFLETQERLRDIEPRPPYHPEDLPDVL